MGNDGVRLGDFPDLGDVSEITRIIAEKGGSGFHSVQALASYIGRLIGITPERYGAKGDGVTDDYDAIATAITEAAKTGADVHFDAKPYLISRTLFVGDGTAAKISAYGGVRLMGVGQPPMPPQFMAGYPVEATRCTRLVWGGALGGYMMHIAGPMHGWGVQNFFFDGCPSGDFGGKADVGLLVVSAMGGDSRNLSFRGCRDGSIYSTATNAPTGVGNSDSLHNSYENICIACAWKDGVKGIVLTGTNASNTDYNHFRNTAIVLPSDAVAAKSAYGVYFQSCDSNVFDGLHFFNGHSQCIGVVFDYTVNPDWPAGNIITSADWGGLVGPVQNFGTPSPNARPNYIYGLVETNGGFMPAGVKNMVTEVGAVATVDIGQQTAAQSKQLLENVARSGLYRVSAYLLVTGGKANGGNLTLTMNWLDGSGSQSFQTPSVANGPGNYQTVDRVVRLNRFGNIAWTVSTPGIGGAVTTEYALMIALERLL